MQSWPDPATCCKRGDNNADEAARCMQAPTRRSPRRKTEAQQMQKFLRFTSVVFTAIRSNSITLPEHTRLHRARHVHVVSKTVHCTKEGGIGGARMTEEKLVYLNTRQSNFDVLSIHIYLIADI